MSNDIGTMATLASRATTLLTAVMMSSALASPEDTRFLQIGLRQGIARDHLPFRIETVVTRDSVGLSEHQAVKRGDLLNRFVGAKTPTGSSNPLLSARLLRLLELEEIRLRFRRVIARLLWELTDSTPEEHSLEAELRAVVTSQPGVLGLDKLHARKMGLSYYVDLHIVVNGQIPVREGHRIAHVAEREILNAVPQVSEVLDMSSLKRS